MRKQVRKQVEKMQARERNRYKTACVKIRQLEVENATLSRTLHVTEGHVSSLETVFEKLEAEHGSLKVNTEAVIENMKAVISRRDTTIRHLRDIIIDELKQPWWRRLFRWSTREIVIEKKKWKSPEALGS